MQNHMENLWQSAKAEEEAAARRQPHQGLLSKLHHKFAK